MSEERSELRERLAREMIPATWALLEPHAGRDALFLIQGVELEEAGTAVALDEESLVAEWIERGVMRRPTATELKVWSEAPVAFKAVIIQPYVLASVIY